MQDKVLKMISKEVLSSNFSYNEKEMTFKEYLVNEVFPYMDLTKNTIMLKTGIEVSLKDFIEQSIFYTCQVKYHGDFVDFANDNLAEPPYKKKEEDNTQTLNISNDDKTYVFYEEEMGPKYMVIIGSKKVALICHDGKNDIVMTEEEDKQGFLMRIKKLDLDLFIDMYNEYEVFRNYVKLFSNDKTFYNSLMACVSNKAFTGDDLEDGKNLFERGEEKEEKVSTFNINKIPLLDTGVLLNIVMKKCWAFYSEFVIDIDTVMEQNSISEKAEYVISEYLIKVINFKFYNYVNRIIEAIDNNLEVSLNDDFISDGLEDIIVNLRNGLKRLFVNPKKSNDTIAADVYINIIVESIQKELIEYEKIVNNNIRGQLSKLQIAIKESNKNTFR